MPQPQPIASWKRMAHFVESRTTLILVVFSLGYLALMHHAAPGRAMWIDEYITFYIARLRPSEIWVALLTGAESHPPPFLLLTHASMRLFGSNPFAMRLPAILGFLLMELCLFRFVAKRATRLLALTAILVPFTTRAVSYAMEARGYGLLLGFTGLSLICWQAAADSPRRKFAILGLASSLAASVCCHYFGALIVLPLVAGQLVRSLARKQADPSIWIAFAAPAIPLLAFLPLLRASSSYAEKHGLLNSEFDYFSFLLSKGHALLLVLLLAIAVYTALRDCKPIELPRSIGSAFPLHEVAAIVGCILLPIVAFVLTRMIGLPFANRYVLSAVIGVSVLVALAIDILPQPEVVAILVLTGLFVSAGGSYVLQMTAKARRPEPEDRFLLTHTTPGLPIVASDIDSFLRLAQSGPEPVRRRVVYLTNPEAAFHYLGNNTSDRILIDLRPWLPMQIEPFCEYLSKTREFHVYGPIDLGTNWLTSALTDEQAAAEIVAINADRVLLLVRPKAPSRFCIAALLTPPPSVVSTL
jgi:hypothetical protein